jgi:hypothetical protein
MSLVANPVLRVVVALAFFPFVASLVLLDRARRYRVRPIHWSNVRAAYDLDNYVPEACGLIRPALWLTAATLLLFFVTAFLGGAVASTIILVLPIVGVLRAATRR